MKRFAVVLIVGSCAFVLSSAASADPSGPNVRGVATFACDDGRTVDMNVGPEANRGLVAWVVDSSSVFVVAYTAVTDGVDTFVFLDHTQGLDGLTTCTTPGRPGDTFVTKGFFTPSGSIGRAG
jgi:hypothetical protein